jgi:NAD(P)H-nitrite reductase large subunit
MINQTTPKSVVIIGNGISGITAARHIRKNSDYLITVISDETPYFFSRTALMYVYMGHLQFKHTQPYETTFWEKNRIDLVQKRVRKLRAEKQCLVFEDQSELGYDMLIIASGSKPNKFGWPGQNLKGVRGLYHKKDLEELEKRTSKIKEATVVGGGLIGIELAEMLHSRGKKVHFLVREARFWDQILPREESEMVIDHILDHGIDLQLSTELKSIEGDEKGWAKSITTSDNNQLPSQWVGLCVGVTPNIDFLKTSPLELGKGVKVNAYLETSIPNIYAIGDCAEQLNPSEGRRSIEAVWYTGRMMGETIAQTLTGNRTPYQPGHWFNSAKFFDIEYQTYGVIHPNPELKQERHVFWQHPSKNLSLRLSYHPETKKFLGCIAMGIRLRHEVFDQWLTEGANINDVVKNFAHANFDPEFYKSYEDLLLVEWRLVQPHF